MIPLPSLTGGRSREHSRLAKASVENIILLNKLWNADLQGYRLFVIRKMKKHLQNQNIEFSPFTDYDKEDSQNLPEIPFERLSLSFFVQFLRYLCDNKLKDCKINLRNLSIENEPLRLVIWPSKSVGAHSTKSLKIPLHPF